MRWSQSQQFAEISDDAVSRIFAHFSGESGAFRNLSLDLNDQ